MAAITIYAQSDGDWDKADNWDTSAGGGGTDYTDPQDGTDAFTCDLNGRAITINKTVVVTKIQASATGGTIVMPASANVTIGSSTGVKTLLSSSYAGALLTWTDTGTLTINGTISDSVATRTTAMITCTTNQALIVQNCGGVGTNAITRTAGGTLVTINLTGTGTLTVDNSGGVALNGAAAGGSLLYSNGTGNISLTGDVQKTAGASAATMNVAAAAAISIIGDLIQNSTGTDAASQPNVQFSTGASLTLVGNILGTSYTVSNVLVGGNFTWVGTRTLASGKCCIIRVGNSGNAILATAGSRLTLENSGFVQLIITGTGICTTSDAGAGAAQIVAMAPSSYFHTNLGAVQAAALFIGPTIPAEDNVINGTTYGYAGDLQTGTLVKYTDFII